MPVCGLSASSNVCLSELPRLAILVSLASQFLIM
ncbi:hypothetical protein A2U01_0074257, partial [Trifolium medium]|nr:hypothetical protein [Trifolium medium]